jgi:hypothetical protein
MISVAGFSCYVLSFFDMTMVSCKIVVISGHSPESVRRRPVIRIDSGQRKDAFVDAERGGPEEAPGDPSKGHHDGAPRDAFFRMRCVCAVHTRFLKKVGA